MTTYESTAERARQTPAGALRQRIADLNGWPDVGSRGRMPADLITAYLTAHR